jgi:hypothetical protein
MEDFSAWTIESFSPRLKLSQRAESIHPRQAALVKASRNCRQILPSVQM